MDNEKKTGISMTGICLTVFIVFLALKLTKTITWSWLWVCAPLWIPLAGFVVILVLTLITVIVREILKAMDD